MSTIIKTGCTLRLIPGTYNVHDSNLPPFATARHTSGHILHGDLHAIPHCAILYMPPMQVGDWRDIHGSCELVHDEYFFRKGSGDIALVMPIDKVLLVKEEIGEYEWDQWRCMGGDETDRFWPCS